MTVDTVEHLADTVTARLGAGEQTWAGTSVEARRSLRTRFAELTDQHAAE